MMSSLVDLCPRGSRKLRAARPHPETGKAMSLVQPPSPELFSPSPRRPGRFGGKEYRFYQLTQYEITDKIAGGTQNGPAPSQFDSPL
jgi:hypothetical protein